MNIRRMTVADVVPVHAIEEVTFAMPWSLDSFQKEMVQNVCARYLVAEEADGTIIAYGGAWIILDEAHVTNVAVEKSRRGQGIGRMLMRALMQYSANLGAQYLTLEVRRGNTIAKNLYQSLGFVELAVRKHYYEDNGEDALLMVCDRLPPPEEDFTEESEITQDGKEES
jgi:[ribosomal protein S18]-alanine N-acetyltransferase